MNNICCYFPVKNSKCWLKKKKLKRNPEAKEVSR